MVWTPSFAVIGHHPLPAAAGLLAFGYPVLLIVLAQPLTWHWVGGGFPAAAGVLVLGYVLFMSPALPRLAGLPEELYPLLVMVTTNAAAFVHTAFVLWSARSPWWLAAEAAALVGHMLFHIYTGAKRLGARSLCGGSQALHQVPFVTAEAQCAICRAARLGTVSSCLD